MTEILCSDQQHLVDKSHCESLNLFISDHVHLIIVPHYKCVLWSTITYASLNDHEDQTQLQSLEHHCEKHYHGSTVVGTLLLYNCVIGALL